MTTALVHLIPFRTGHIQAIDKEGKQWVVVRPICADLGLDYRPAARQDLLL